MLDGLVGADGPPEREALLRVGDGHLQARLHRADRLRGQQCLPEVPGVGQRLLADVQHCPARPVQRHVAERARRVVAARLLDGSALDDHRDRAAVAHGDDHQHVGPRRVGYPPGVAAQGSGAVDRGSRRAPLAALRLDRPAVREVVGRPRDHERRPALTAGQRLDPVVAGLVEHVGRQHVPQDRHAGQDASALLQDEHRLEGPEPGTAALLADHQAGPAGLDGRRPQVGQRARILQRLARRLHGLDPGQRVARGLAQQLLLVGEGEVHAPTASRSLARSSLNGIPLSRRGSGGRPSTRSPIVLRRISSVPPADFRPGRKLIM